MAMRKTEKQVFLWDETCPEEGLEDTPVVSPFQPAAPIEAVVPVSSAETVQAPVEASAETAKDQKRTRARHRRGNALTGILRPIADWAAGLFAAPRSNSNGHAAALEFAESRKRLGKKGRRNRRILVYAGSGFAVVVVVLLVLLVPGGAAAPTDATVGANDAISNPVTKSAALSASATDSAVSSVSATESTAVPTSTPVLSPTVSPTPIPTTAVDPVENPIDMNELLEFFVVKADKYYSYSNNHYNYTENDVRILAQLIYLEARGESTTGKIAVANVVMNRVLNRHKFGNTIYDVVTAPKQFAYRSDVNPTRSCISAARQVLQNEVWVIPQDVYYFRAVSKFSSLEGQNWGSHTYYQKIGGHYFYRHSYSGRIRGGGVPPALYDRVYKYAQLGCKPEDRVYRIQYMLDALGYDIEKVDKYFGEGTEEALIKFQKDHGLDDDGVAGPATVRKLIEKYGSRKYYSKFCT
jgi:hypothetical protein